MMTNLVPNMWYAVVASHEVPAGKPIGLKRLGEEMVFWRDAQGKIVVMRDLCPHRQSKLSPGKIVDGNLQCHFHGFQYDREGACQLIPANGRNGPKPKIFQCRNFVAQEGHGFIWVWTGEKREEYPPLPYFEGLDDFVTSIVGVHWNVHYTRSVEGVLDVSHLPFVHAKTIGRGMRTLVNGPYTTLEDNKIRIWVSNQPDAGLPALKPTEVPPPDGQPGLSFNFPNVWMLWLSEKYRNLLISAPIDEENTMVYLVSAQRFLKTPGIGRLVSWLMNQANKYVLTEDEYIIFTQTPKAGSLDAGYFIPGDRPIALYLQHRQELIEAGKISQEREKEVAQKRVIIGKLPIAATNEVTAEQN